MNYTEEQKKIMLAWIDGKVIQTMDRRFNTTWTTCVNPIWDWHIYDYRIKPEPELKDGVLFMLDGIPVKKGDKIYHIEEGIVIAEFPANGTTVVVRHPSGAVPTVNINDLYFPKNINTAINLVMNVVEDCFGKNTPATNMIRERIKKKLTY